MDEAFIGFSKMIDNILSINGEFWDRENGVHSYISEIEVGTPVELDIQVDADGAVKIGAVPPLYRVNTSFRPSYHSVTIKAIYHTGKSGADYASNGENE